MHLENIYKHHKVVLFPFVYRNSYDQLAQLKKRSHLTLKIQKSMFWNVISYLKISKQRKKARQPWTYLTTATGSTKLSLKKPWEVKSVRSIQAYSASFALLGSVENPQKVKDVVPAGEDLTFSREMKFGTYGNWAMKPPFVFIISKCSVAFQLHVCNSNF